MSAGRKVVIDRVVVHGGRLDPGDIGRLPAAIRAAVGGTSPAASTDVVGSIAQAVAGAVPERPAGAPSRGGVR